MASVKQSLIATRSLISWIKNIIHLEVTVLLWSATVRSSVYTPPRTSAAKSSPSGQDVDRSIEVTCGLRPSLSTYLTLAAERHPNRVTISITQPSNDPLLETLKTSGNSSLWASPVSPPSLKSTPGISTIAVNATAAGSTTQDKLFNNHWATLSVLGLAEAAALPLLRAYSSGNTSWLEQLEAAAAAGEHPLPNEMLVPRPGKPGGPAAVPLLLLYRRDWWRALVAAAGGGGSDPSAEEVAVLPPTWPLLVQLVSELLNRDLDGDGRQDHVLCVDLMPGCKGWALLSAIFASLVQTNGTEQGVWFNLTNLMPALGGPALPTALQLYGDLAASNAAPFTPGGSAGSRSSVPVAPSELLAGGGAVDAATGAPLCGAINPLFAAGRCLFTIDWAAAALRLTKEAAPGVSGKIAAALLPGSSMVQGPAAAANVDTTPTAAMAEGNSFASPSSSTPDRASLETQKSLSSAGLHPCSPSTCWSYLSRPHSDPPSPPVTATPGVAAPPGTNRPGATTWGDAVRPSPLPPPLRLTTAAAGNSAGAGVAAATATEAVAAVAAAAAAEPYVNVAPFVGEASNVWLIAPTSDLKDISRAGEFTEHVGYELDFKYGIFTNQTLEFREFNVIHPTPQRQQQKQQLLLQVNDPIVALRSSLRGETGAPETTCFPSSAASGGGGSGGGGLLSLLASTVATTGGSASSEASMQASLDLDLDPSDLLFVSRVAAKAVAHGNVALDITLPYSTTYRQILDDLATSALRAAADVAAAVSESTPSVVRTKGAALAATSNAAVTSPIGTRQLNTGASPVASGGDAAGWLQGKDLLVSLAAAAASDFDATTKRFPYRAILRQLYWNSIGHSETSGASAGDKAVAAAGGSSSGSSGGGSASSQNRNAATRRVWMPLGAALGGLVGLMILLGGYYLVVTSQYRRLLVRNGRTAQPPGASAATTLVMTDIQNSTLLWEVLSASVMDTCLATHHRIMRQAIECHSGYEVFTEGDAFAVAFHGPGDALGFALDVQNGLLQADWPQPLLEQPDASEVWTLLHKPCRSVVQQPHLMPPNSFLRRASRMAGGPPAVAAGCTGGNDGDAAAATSTPASGLMAHGNARSPLLEQQTVSLQPGQQGIKQLSDAYPAAVSDCDVLSPSLPFPTAAVAAAASASASAVASTFATTSPTSSLGIHASAARSRFGLIAVSEASPGGGGGGGGGGGHDIGASGVLNARSLGEQAGAPPAQQGMELDGQCDRRRVLTLTAAAPVQQTQGSVAAVQPAAALADTCNRAPLQLCTSKGFAKHSVATAATATIISVHDATANAVTAADVGVTAVPVTTARERKALEAAEPPPTSPFQKVVITTGDVSDASLGNGTTHYHPDGAVHLHLPLTPGSVSAATLKKPRGCDSCPALPNQCRTKTAVVMSRHAADLTCERNLSVHPRRTELTVLRFPEPLGQEEDEGSGVSQIAEWQSLVNWEDAMDQMAATATAAAAAVVATAPQPPTPLPPPPFTPLPSAPEPLSLVAAESLFSWRNGSASFRISADRGASTTTRRRRNSSEKDSLGGGDANGGGGDTSNARVAGYGAAIATVTSSSVASLPQRLLTGGLWGREKQLPVASDTNGGRCVRHDDELPLPLSQQRTQMASPPRPGPQLQLLLSSSSRKRPSAEPPAPPLIQLSPPLPLASASAATATMTVTATARDRPDDGKLAAIQPSQTSTPSLGLIPQSDGFLGARPIASPAGSGLSLAAAAATAAAAAGAMVSGGTAAVTAPIKSQESPFDILWRDLNLLANYSATGGRVSTAVLTPAEVARGGGEAAAETLANANGGAAAAAEPTAQPSLPRTVTVLSVLQKLYKLVRPGDAEDALLGFRSELGFGTGLPRDGQHSLQHSLPCRGPSGSAAVDPVAATAAEEGGPVAAPEPFLVFRGVRVRMGLHSGPQSHEVTPMLKNNGSKGVSYTGDFLAVSKEVGDAAMGGVIVLSESAFLAHQQQLRASTSGGAAAIAKGASNRDICTAAAIAVSVPMILHIGKHAIQQATYSGKAAPARELYTAVSPVLLARLAVLPSPVRTAREVVPGCLSAPAGVVAPVFCNVVGVEALIAWEKVLTARMLRAAAAAAVAATTLSAGVSLSSCRQLPPCSSGGAGGGIGGGSSASFVGIVRESLEIFRAAAQRMTKTYDGYVVASSADGGHWVLVFGSAENAVLWGLGMLEAMLAAAWPEGLLDHELAEEVWEDGVLLNRGLRLRIGIDCGAAMIRLVPRTGRLDYVGRPLNRAARIAAKAKAATMLVSGAVWAASRRSLEPSGVRAVSLGSMSLKGVQKQIDLWAIGARTQQRNN